MTKIVAENQKLDSVACESKHSPDAQMVCDHFPSMNHWVFVS